MSPLPDSVSVVVRYRDAPLVGAVIGMLLQTDYKNDYFQVFGPTGPDGEVHVSGGTIVERANREAANALMDYGLLEQCFTGSIRIEVLVEEGLTRALDAYSYFRGVGYKRGYKRMLQRALGIMKSCDSDQISLKVQIEPPSAAITVLTGPETSS